jgi:hypothetical protein
MMKRFLSLIVILVLCSLSFLGLTLLRISNAKASPPQQYPIMDNVADKIIQKYQTSTCEQLWPLLPRNIPLLAAWDLIV